MVLLGVQHFQQGRGRISAEIIADLIDLIQYDHRVGRFAFPYALYDTAGHGADIGFPVAAHFAFIMQAAQAHTYIFTADGMRDGTAK
jgi:hypothetical protein